jgi:hypothetical protein
MAEGETIRVPAPPGWYVCYTPGRGICWPQGYPTKEQAEKQMAELIATGMEASKIHVVEVK